ncbi:uncharacterized protein At4g14100-like isoform X2 [Chenopodium quinoa]|uniref:uncharacterized protein At4g14100-like isoform X2 n=1 Tax=Chenopodium quinoa TaxID=63459 RepID=UPI000B773DBF|nr:uncharacterized protein At4g14100-like isoform X2 [Chenopodium quinoa]
MMDCILKEKMKTTIIMMIFCLVLTNASSNRITEKKDEDPKPKPWPEQFHSVLVINNTKKNELQVTDLWYDWPNGRNLNLIQKQLVLFDVGILRPNWLEGATYLGQQHMDGFLCNVWQKVDFLWYYEDVVTRRPVYWLFYTGRAVHVITFEEGAVLEDSQWQAPVYCFNKKEEKEEQQQIDGYPHQFLRDIMPLVFT